MNEFMTSAQQNFQEKIKSTLLATVIFAEHITFLSSFLYFWKVVGSRGWDGISSVQWLCQKQITFHTYHRIIQFLMLSTAK
jgi:hypothetical protein